VSAPAQHVARLLFGDRSEAWSMLLIAISIEPRSSLNFWNVRIGMIAKRSWLWPRILPFAIVTPTTS
jgi:hypothetical protein